MANLCCSIEMEPRTLREGQLNHARVINNLLYILFKNSALLTSFSRVSPYGWHLSSFYRSSWMSRIFSSSSLSLNVSSFESDELDLEPNSKFYEKRSLANGFVLFKIFGLAWYLKQVQCLSMLHFYPKSTSSSQAIFVNMS